MKYPVGTKVYVKATPTNIKEYKAAWRGFYDEHLGLEGKVVEYPGTPIGMTAAIFLAADMGYEHDEDRPHIVVYVLDDVLEELKCSPNPLRLRKVVAELVRASIEDSWKGGGDPADIPAIKEELRVAEEAFERLFK